MTGNIKKLCGPAERGAGDEAPPTPPDYMIRPPIEMLPCIRGPEL